MGLSKTVWTKPSEYIRTHRPDAPVLFFAPSVLQARAVRFIDGFPGMVTYAVKSNPEPVVIQNLAAAGVRGFDVASPAEMRAVRAVVPDAALHYNNPVRARHEIAAAVEMGVRSYSVDSRTELEKLIAMVPAKGCEISVRFTVPVSGAAYGFAAKFGAAEDLAVALLVRVAEAGFVPSLAFHPGTQCTDPAAWTTHIAAAGRIARAAGVRVARLNVGGGFPNHRLAAVAPDMDAIFDAIDDAADDAFGAERPQLVCEPGRGLCGDAFALAARVKAVRDGRDVFLNDGTYGSLTELTMIGVIDRVEVMAPDGTLRGGERSERTIFGPTCDSVDRLPAPLPLADGIEEGDYVVFQGMGAYSAATNTRFNGFGDLSVATVLSLKL